MKDPRTWLKDRKHNQGQGVIFLTPEEVETLIGELVSITAHGPKPALIGFCQEHSWVIARPDPISETFAKLGARLNATFGEAANRRSNQKPEA